MTQVDARQPSATTATMPPLEEPSIKRIQPTKARIRLADLYPDLPVIRVLAARDFKVKYKQSLLGPLWLVFQPLALLAPFLVAFRGLADVQAGVPYTVFALVGLSGWTFFQASMTIGAASLVSNVTLVRYTPCPRLAFPVAGILASLGGALIWELERSPWFGEASSVRLGGVAPPLSAPEEIVVVLAPELGRGAIEPAEASLGGALPR